MRSLIVSVACVCSSVGPVAAGTSTTTESLFGFELQLDGVQTWPGPDGQTFVGWPASDAEVMLEVFENRIPEMKRIIETHEALEEAQAAQIENLKTQVVTTSSIADHWKDIAGAWRKAAETPESSLAARIFKSPILWGVVAFGAGVGVTAWIYDKAKD